MSIYENQCICEIYLRNVLSELLCWESFCSTLWQSYLGPCKLKGTHKKKEDGFYNSSQYFCFSEVSVLQFYSTNVISGFFLFLEFQESTLTVTHCHPSLPNITKMLFWSLSNRWELLTAYLIHRKECVGFFSDVKDLQRGPYD